MAAGVDGGVDVAHAFLGSVFGFGCGCGYGSVWN